MAEAPAAAESADTVVTEAVLTDVSAPAAAADADETALLKSRVDALFESMDTDGSGEISRKELAAKLRADGELEALLGVADATTIPQVVRVVRMLEQTGEIDRDRDSFITCEELETGLLADRAAAANAAADRAAAARIAADKAVSAIAAATPRPPYGFVSHAEWAPDLPFVCHPMPSEVPVPPQGATPARISLAPPVRSSSEDPSSLLLEEAEVQMDSARAAASSSGKVRSASSARVESLSSMSVSSVSPSFPVIMDSEFWARIDNGVCRARYGG